jgi:hypothetical protein
MRNGFDTLLEIVQGNYGFALPFTLQDSSGAAVDITSASLAFKAQLESDPSVQFSGAMAIVSGPGGTCSYTVAQTDFPTSGVWNAQIVATFTGEVLTFTGIVVKVVDQIPVS